MALERIGALWLKERKDGSKFMAGEIEVNGKKFSIMVFKNNRKKEDKHPDYNIAMLIEDENSQKGDDDDDIPF